MINNLHIRVNCPQEENDFPWSSESVIRAKIMDAAVHCKMALDSLQALFPMSRVSFLTPQIWAAS